MSTVMCTHSCHQTQIRTDVPIDDDEVIHKQFRHVPPAPLTCSAVNEGMQDNHEPCEPCCSQQFKAAMSI